MSTNVSLFSYRTLVLCAIASSILSSLLTFSAVWLIPNSFGFTHRLSVGNTASHNGGLGLAEEFNKLIPEFPRVFKVQPERSEYGVYTDADLKTVLDRWDTLIPRGQGFIHMPQHASYNLTPPMIYRSWSNTTQTFVDEPYYSVAVFHQLHCLTGLLEVYLSTHHPKLALKRKLKRERDGDGDGNVMKKILLRHHSLHCFDYIREAIMCQGDVALEGADVIHGRHSIEQGTFGVGTTHVCKDWKKLVEYAEAHGNSSWY